MIAKIVEFYFQVLSLFRVMVFAFFGLIFICLYLVALLKSLHVLSLTCGLCSNLPATCCRQASGGEMSFIAGGKKHPAE